jgi:hypothetical protein
MTEQKTTPLIEAFLKLHDAEKKYGNPFVAAVKINEKTVNEKYMGFKKLEKSIASKGDVKDPAAVAASIGREKYGSEKFQKAAAAGKKMKEEFSAVFSEEELAHFNAVMEAMPVDQGKANQKKLAVKNSERGIGDTIPARDITDSVEVDEESLDEMAKRGRKPGVKVGPYKKKGMVDAERDEAQAETKRVAAQAKTTRSHFDNSGKEVVGLTHPETKKTYNVPLRHVNDFHKAYQTAEKPADKERVESDFMKKHMSS